MNTTKDAIGKIDRLIHEPARLSIISFLVAQPTWAASFSHLKENLEMTSGNLSVQLKNLEEAGYIRSDKSFQDNRPLTKVLLTEEGYKALCEYLEVMEKIIQGMEKNKS